MRRIPLMVVATTLAVAAIGCNRDRARDPASQGSSTDAPVCEPLPFATASPVAEASGAAWWSIGGDRALVVISDSGGGGAYAIVEPEGGETLATGVLPLGDGAGDDLEGVAVRGGMLHAITSAGWARSWRRDGDGFALADGPYPLAAVELPDRRNDDKPPLGTGMVCGARATNCGRNYEGLCLHDRPAPDGACVGFAASKADGHLYCVVEHGGKLAVRYQPRIAIARPGTVSDCAFDDDGTLWVGTNLFDGARVYRVDGWDQPATASVTELARLGIGFPETLAVRGDVVYRMSDTGGAPSLMAKFRCPR